MKVTVKRRGDQVRAIVLHEGCPIEVIDSGGEDLYVHGLSAFGGVPGPLWFKKPELKAICAAKRAIEKARSKGG